MKIKKQEPKQENDYTALLKPVGTKLTAVDLKTNKIMKNVHVIPTDKPSRLYSDKGKLWLDDLVYGDNNQHIYITSDEEIKEGDWVYCRENHLITKAKTKLSFMLANAFKTAKKIILTTDQHLIKDGVQYIDDDFLEWFVKNPSCEEVEVVKTAPIRPFGSLYKIIIPKEEKDYTALLQPVGTKQTAVELDFTSWRKKNTIMLIKGGWFGNQTPCYVGDAKPKTEKEWKDLYEKFKNK